MQLSFLILLIAAVTHIRGDLLDGLEHDHDHHLEQHHDLLEEIHDHDDKDLRSLDLDDDDVPFSDDQYEDHLLNEISKFLPREEFNIQVNDNDDNSLEEALLQLVPNPPGQQKSFSVQEPIQQPLLVQQPFGIPLQIQPKVQREPPVQDTQSVVGVPLPAQPQVQQQFKEQLPQKQVGIALQVEQQQPLAQPQPEPVVVVPEVKSQVPLLPKLEQTPPVAPPAAAPAAPAQGFGIVPEESFDYNDEPILDTSIEDLTNFLPEPVVVVPATNAAVVPNPPEVQKVVVRTSPAANRARQPSPPAVDTVVVDSPPVEKTPVVTVTDLKSPNLDSLSAPSLTLTPSQSDYDDFSDNSIGGQGRQLDAPRNLGTNNPQRSFDPFEGDFPRYGPFPPPISTFKCEDHDLNGYYTDLDFGCQVFHICLDEKLLGTFLCPNGTLFSQKLFVCDWWFNVECDDSPSYYHLNERIGKIPGDSDEDYLDD